MARDRLALLAAGSLFAAGALLAATLLALAPSAGAATAARPAQRPVNVILMIADGCGPCAKPPGCSEMEPSPMPDPLRAS